MAKVLIVGALAKSLYNFRGELIKSLVAAGHEVVAMAEYTDTVTRNRIEGLGVSFREYPVQRNSMNPRYDFATFIALNSALKDINPQILLAYTIKPVVWGGLAALINRVPFFYALIEGAGYAFQDTSWRRKFVRIIASFLYKVSLYKATKVIFLNHDNLNHFIQLGLVKKSRTEIIDGIGLDLDWYRLYRIPATGFCFLCIARLLGEKGLREFASAASLVKVKYPDTVFSLVGQIDPSPDGIPLDEVAKWEESGAVNYVGSLDDVRPAIKICHVYVLPSYHEGMPRTIMEAMAMGRPILTTDVPGCRETVVHGKNGYLVPAKNVYELSNRMMWFIENRNMLDQMGLRSRQIAEERFDVTKINADMMRIMGLE